VVKNQINYTQYLVYAMIFFSWSSIYFYSPTLSTFASAQGASSEMIGCIIGGFGLVQTLLRAPLGILSDNMSRRKIFLNIGMIAACIGPLGMALFPTPVGLLIFRSLAGVTAATWVIATVLQSSYFEEKDVLKVVGRCNMVNSAGNVCGMLIGSIVVESHGQILAFYCAAVIALIALILSLFIKENLPKEVTRVSIRMLVSIGRNKRLQAMALLAMLFQVIFTGTSASFTPVYASSIGATASQLGILSILSMIGMGFGAILSNYFDKRGAKTGIVIAVAFGVYACATLVIPMCKEISALYIVQLVQGLSGFTAFTMLMGKSIIEFPKEKRGAAMGIFQSTHTLGMFIGPMLSGTLHSMMPVGSVFAVLAGIGALAVMLTNWWLIKKVSITSI
jgi:MFS family permease